MNIKDYAKSTVINEVDNIKFFEEIESIRHLFDSYIDAIAFYCEKNNIEIESTVKLLCPQLKERIQDECMQSKMLNGYKSYSKGNLDSLDE